MARTIKPNEYASKRKEILKTAQRLVITRGYERMAVQDILDELHISSGAFHHYFESRIALLEALIDFMQQEAELPLLAIVRDPLLPALEKLQQFFGTLDQSRTAQKAFLIDLARVWFADDNAIVRVKVDEAVIRRRAPLLTEIVRQGRREGVFTTLHPDQAGEIILALSQGMGNTLVRLMLAFVQKRDERHYIDEIVATYAAYADAIERVLGAPAGFLHRPDAAAVMDGFTLEQDY